MANRVVYLLGAGFSAGLGLPVTANFLSRARDLRDQEPNNLFLSTIIDRIDQLSGVKNIFRSDLFNIEEALSILEIDELAAEKLPPQSLRRFIECVIKGSTPSIPKPGAWNGGKLIDVVGNVWNRYASVVIGLFGKRVTTLPNTAYLHCEADSKATATYSVITLNYDRILESVCDITREHPFEKSLAISFDSIVRPPAANAPALVKLHGSVDHEILVPPTWQKVLHPEVKPLLQRAHSSLREANHLRIIGYSLPTTDSYVPYLLKAGLRAARNLKSIDVLCLDNVEQEVKKRYDSLFDFHEFRFRSENVINYLNGITIHIESGAGFEFGHNAFFGRSTADAVGAV